MSLQSIYFPYLIYLSVFSIIATPNLCIESQLSKSKVRIKLSERHVSILLTFIAYLIYIVFSIGKNIDVTYGNADMWSYERHFLLATGNIYDFMFHRTTFEWGYSLLEYIIRLFTDNFKIFLFICYTLNFKFLVNYLRYANQRSQSILQIVGISNILIRQFVTLRMSIAIIVALNSLIYMDKQKWIKALLFVIIASSIQISSIVFFTVLVVEYVFRNKEKYSINQTILICLSGVIIVYALTPLIIHYMSSSTRAVYIDETSTFGKFYLIAIIVWYICYRNYDEIVTINTFNSTLIRALPCVLFVLPLQLRISIMYRLTSYFPAIVITLLNAHSIAMRKKKIIYRLIGYTLYFSYVTYSVINSFSSGNGLGMYVFDLF